MLKPTRTAAELQKLVALQIGSEIGMTTEEVEARLPEPEPMVRITWLDRNQHRGKNWGISSLNFPGHHPEGFTPAMNKIVNDLQLAFDLSD